jgi:hypothetical protein
MRYTMITICAACWRVRVLFTVATVSLITGGPSTAPNLVTAARVAPQRH